MLEAIIGFRGSGPKGKRMILLWGGLNLEQNWCIQTVLVIVVDILTWPVQILCWVFIEIFWVVFYLVANFKQWLQDCKMSYSYKTDYRRVDGLENTPSRNTAEA